MLQMLSPPRLATPIRWACYGALISLPISIAALNVFLGLAILLALISQEFWQSSYEWIRHPVIQIAGLLFLFLAIGTLYSSAPGSESFNYLWRYKKLLLIPLLIPVFQEPRYRYQACACFCVSTFLTVLISWSEFFHLTHWSDPAHGDFTGDSVFVMHITQGYLYAMLVALTLALFLASQNWISKVLWALIGLVTMADICFVMWGKTGKATLIVLFIWACWEWLNSKNWLFKTKAIIQTLCICVALGGTFILAKNPSLSFGVIVSDLERAENKGEITSQGLRKQFAKDGVIIFLKSPWIGHGTGSILTEQSILAKQALTPVEQVVTVNLHNEYLMQAAQIGITGLILFISWIALTWISSLNPALTWQGIGLRGTILVFASGCLFNSYLWDHIEGYTYILMLAVMVPLKTRTVISE